MTVDMSYNTKLLSKKVNKEKIFLKMTNVTHLL